MKQAVILAAGWGTRMKPLTYNRPKPALKVAGKTLLEYNLSQLEELVDEVVLVVGYKKEIIKKELGDSYGNINLKYVVQEEQLGTGDAAKTALSHLNSRFLILNGDDLYDREDLKKCLESDNPCILVKEVKDPSQFGQVVHEDSQVTDLVEKPEEKRSNLVNIGAYFIDEGFFEVDIEKSERGEYEITDYIRKNLTKRQICFKKAGRWDSVSYPWNLIEVTERFIEAQDEKREGGVDKTASLEGKVILEEGAKIKSGTKVIGPAYIGRNTTVGPNSYIRGGTSIGSGCRVGQSVEIKSSVLAKNVNVPHLAYVGDSVIGSGCNLGAGVVTANLRFDENPVKTKVKGERIDTGRKKFGAVLAEGVKVGVNASFMPGVMVGPECKIYPNQVVKKSLSKNTDFKDE